MKHLKIKINNLEFDGETILKDIDFVLNKTDRIAIVGQNGAGKTTLLKVLTGEIKASNSETPPNLPLLRGGIEQSSSFTRGRQEGVGFTEHTFDGNIDNIGNLTLGYLKQIHTDNENKLVREELKDAFKNIIEIEKKLNEIEKKMASIEEKGNLTSLANQKFKENKSTTLSSNNLLNKSSDNLSSLIETYTSLLEQFNNIGGNDYNNKIHNVANGIKIFDLLDKKLCEVSGGQRTKIALAKVLLESPDMLFLDEPTNFIDMGSVEWLEGFLQNKWKSGYVIISHDREFLDKTCNKTYEVQPARGITYYHTNYTGYLEEREKIEKKKLENYKREQEYIEKEEKLINRFRAGSRAGWAKSREKSLEKREKLDLPYIPKKPKFFFNYIGESPEKILQFKECFIGRTEPLFFINEVVLYRKQRIGIVGENGVGKSTFLKTIIGQLNILDGTYTKGKGLQIGYYSQLHEELNKNKTIRENFLLAGLHYSEEHLIGLLKHYLFEKEDLDKKVNDLSGGQISKLFFAILGQKEYNLLVLDEPTNHLDYDTRESLEKSLKEFPGSILFISHDRYFVNKLATNIWFITNNELSISYGNYEDYRFKLEHNIDMDMNLFDEEAELNFVLQEKLGEKEFKKLKKKFSESKSRRR